MDGQHINGTATKTPLKIHDPESASPNPPWRDKQSSAILDIVGKVIGAILALAATVAALAVFALACNFLKWAMFG